MRNARRLPLILTLTLLCSSAILAQGLPVPELEWPAEQGKVTIPFDHEHGFIVIPVSVMGSRDLQMILDSGAPLMVIPGKAVFFYLPKHIHDQPAKGGLHQLAVIDHVCH